MWYNPILLKKEKLEKAVERAENKELRETLASLRQQLQYLTSYRTSQYRQLYRRFN